MAPDEGTGAVDGPTPTPEPGTIILFLAAAGAGGGTAVRKWVKRKK